MPLTRKLLARTRSLFTGRSGGALVALWVGTLLIGWALLLLAVTATAIADLIGLLGPGARVPVVARLAIGLAVLLMLGALVGSARTPAGERSSSCGRPSAAMVRTIEQGMTYGDQHLENSWVIATGPSGGEIVAGVATFANGNTYFGAWGVDGAGAITAVNDWATVYSDWPDATDSGSFGSETAVKDALERCGAG